MEQIKEQPKSDDLTLDDIEAVFCGTATKEQHDKYVAAFTDPNSELNAMLNYIQNKPKALDHMDEILEEHERSKNRK